MDMKGIRMFVALLMLAAVAGACKDDPEGYDKVVTDAEREASRLLPSASLADSVSYLMGVNTAYYLMNQGFAYGDGDVDMEQFNQGMSDALKYGAPKFTSTSSGRQEMDSTYASRFRVSPQEFVSGDALKTYVRQLAQYNALLNSLVGEKWLEQNKSKSGVLTTESGLQYVIHAQGEGEVAQKDTLTIRYKGTLLDGTEFDSSDSYVFPVPAGRNQGDFMTVGLLEGISLIGNGAHATFYIPSELAYGKAGARGVGANSALIFEVEILDVKKFQDS